MKNLLLYLCFSFLLITLPINAGIIDSLITAAENSSGIEKIDNLNTLTVKLIALNRYEDGLNYAVEALELAEEINYDEGRVLAYINLNSAYTYLNQPESALTNGERALQIATRKHFRFSEADALRGLGITYNYMGRYEEAADHLRRSINIAEEAGHKFGIASGYTSLGIVYVDQGKTSEALDAQKKAAEAFLEIGETDDAGSTYLNIGSIYTNVLYDFENGLEYTLKALSIFEEKQDTFKTGYCLLVIGTIYDELGNFEKALEYSLKSLDIFRERDHKVLVSINLNNIGELYKNKGDCETALTYYNESLEINASISRNAGIAVALNNIGECYFLTGKYNQAEEYFTRSLKLLNELGDIAKQAVVRKNFGKLSLARNNPSQALSYFHEALENAKTTETNEQIAEINKYLSDAYSSAGNYRKALEYYKNYTEESDSIKSIAKSREIARLQIEYETDKKENEIEILKKDSEIQSLVIKRRSIILYFSLGLLLLFIITAVLLYKRNSDKKKHSAKMSDSNEKITSQKNELEHINSELKEINKKLTESELRLTEINHIKDTFFSIISHDLKSPFTSLLGMSDLLYEDIDDMDKPEIKRYAGELNIVANNVYLLLENLLEWSLSQREGFVLAKEKINLKKIVEKNIPLFEKNLIQKELTLVKEFHENVYITADTDMISSVIRNLLNNAIKYSLKTGKITLRISTDENNATLEIEDNGVGIESARLAGLFSNNPGISTPGTANEKGTGLGLILSRDFVEMNQGILTIHSKINEGTTVRIIFPKYKKGE